MSTIAMRSPNNQNRRPAFTLVEMLVTVSIIVVLVALLLPVVRKVAQAGSATRELNLARQLMVGFASYTQDNRGVLLPGYYDKVPSLPAHDQYGHALGAEESHRYLWRLAPYLDYNVETLFLDPTLVEALRATNQFEYFLSLYTPLGMNTMFIGGDSRPEGLGFNAQFQQIYGDFYLTRMSQAKRPAELITFGSARCSAPYTPQAPPVIEGFHRIESPYLFNRRWSTDWDPTNTPKLWGYLSMRDSDRQAAIGYLDGHAGYLDDGQIQDMRRWVDQADTPNWTLEPQ